jgi:hypothetical protein
MAWRLPQGRSPVVIHLSASYDPTTDYAHMGSRGYRQGILLGALKVGVAGPFLTSR